MDHKDYVIEEIDLGTIFSKIGWWKPMRKLDNGKRIPIFFFNNFRSCESITHFCTNRMLKSIHSNNPLVNGGVNKSHNPAGEIWRSLGWKPARNVTCQLRTCRSKTSGIFTGRSLRKGKLNVVSLRANSAQVLNELRSRRTWRYQRVRRLIN